MKILIGIFIFSFIVFFHELGHFLMAKLNHIRVDEFSLGFGPKLLHFKKGETEYCIKLIPLGGSCMMDTDPNEELDEHAFNNASVGARIAVVIGGPAFNFILAFVLSAVMILLSGIDRPMINEVTEGYPAQKAGLMPGDEIVKLNDHRTYFFRDVSMYIAFHNGEPLQVIFERDGKERMVTVNPVFIEDEGRYIIGITNTEGYTSATGLSVLKYSYCEVRYWIYSTLQGIRMLFEGQAKASDLSGPVGIVEAVGDTYEQTQSYGPLIVFINMLNIAILLSANLGVMNLIPIPALDGGKLLLYLIEVIIRRRLPEKLETAVTAVGLAMLLSLMIFVIGNDIHKLFM